MPNPYRQSPERIIADTSPPNWQAAYLEASRERDEWQAAAYELQRKAIGDGASCAINTCTSEASALSRNRLCFEHMQNAWMDLRDHYASTPAPPDPPRPAKTSVVLMRSPIRMYAADMFGPPHEFLRDTPRTG